MKRKFICCFIILSMLLTAFAANVFTDGGITVYVNENVLQCDTSPFVENGRTMVPMRAIFEALGAEIDWDAITQTITAVKDDVVISVQINNSIMYNNGISEGLDVAPVIAGNTAFVPLRAVSQALKASVEWIGEVQTVFINSPSAYISALNIKEEEQQTEATVTIYAPDGRCAEVAESEVESYRNVGWYLEPVTLMYSAAGNTVYVANSQIDAYQNVGWYLKPVATIYSPAGNTAAVFEDEIPAYLSVGWYRTYDEAQAAAKKSTSTSGKSYNSSNSNSPNSGGSAVYRTPYGKRYHFDPDCGGKNSYRITLQQAKNAGLTPCKKCAY